MGTLIKTFKASFLPFFDELSPYITPMWVSSLIFTNIILVFCSFNFQAQFSCCTLNLAFVASITVFLQGLCSGRFPLLEHFPACARLIFPSFKYVCIGFFPSQWSVVFPLWEEEKDAVYGLMTQQSSWHVGNFFCGFILLPALTFLSQVLEKVNIGLLDMHSFGAVWQLLSSGLANWIKLSAVQYNYGHKNIISISYIDLACTFCPLMLMEFLLHLFSE